MAPGAATDGASSIQVAIRVRPFTIREAAQLTRCEDGPLFIGDGSLAAAPAPKLAGKGLRSVIKVMDEKCLIFDPPEESPVHRVGRTFMPAGKRVKDTKFAFDRVFDENAEQGDIYEATTKNLLDSVLDGYNATVFAYGATGCGKTHTITGSAQQPGIIFLTMQELFEKVDELRETKESEITLSYLEIYNETIQDLLCPGNGGRSGLMLREDSRHAVSVAGLTSHKPQNVQEVMDMVIQGNSNRTQSPTEANATSSRSHAVLQVNISLKDRDTSVNEPLTMATLSIIDLAGSERASATKNRGERLIEGANINKSLLALGSCINALCDPRKKNHVPYRNSKLTRLLKFSLGGNCRTVMIVCVSPSSQHFDETQNTLRYADRAKNIQTKSIRNVYNVDRHVKDYLKKIDEQMARINELTAQQKQHEDLAFAKFRKAESRRAEIAFEGVQKIRTAYSHATEERKDRISNMCRLRQTERRIRAINGWVDAFDRICETREEEEPSVSLVAMRKTACGILTELESSRHHFHQRLAKNNWTRSIDTALSDALRKLQELDGAVKDGSDESTLKKEVELLKSQADVEAHLAVFEQEKTGEAGLMHVLLSAHFETVAILNQIMQMTEEDAVQAARDVLGKLLRSTTEATGQVIKPDGGLQIVEAVAPTRSGTPKKRKQIPLAGPSPMKNKIRQTNLETASALPPHMAMEMQDNTPRQMSSPRRRIRVGSPRKGTAFVSSPRKKSPSKKRAVRWRDDAEDGASLVDIQPTPKPFSSSPVELTNTSLEVPTLSVSADGELDSSPLPIIPASASLGEPRKSGTGRFANGFLSKKSDSSPTTVPPSLTLGSFSSEDDTSPLRDLAANSAAHRRASSLSILHRSGSPEAASKENANPEDSTWLSSGSDSERTFGADKATAEHIRSAMKLKRTSSIGANKRQSIHRRRSPTAATASPPHDANFSASHARRMVKSDRDDSRSSILAPRSTPVMKSNGPMPIRRSMVDVSGTPREGLASRGHVRASSIVPGSARSNAKAAWR